MSNLAGRIHDAIFRIKVRTPARLYAWLLAPSCILAVVTVAVGAGGPLQLIVIATEATLVLFHPIRIRGRKPSIPIDSAVGPAPGGYRSSTRASEDAAEVIGFVKRAYTGEDLSRSQITTRICTAGALLAVGVPAGAYALDLVCVAVIFSSIPATQRWLTRRRLRRAGLHAELAEYEASLQQS